MQSIRRRSRLLPWYLGLAIIAATDLYIAYQFYATECQATGLAQALVLVVIPGVYLVLMYLTLTSEE